MPLMTEQASMPGNQIDDKFFPMRLVLVKPLF